MEKELAAYWRVLLEFRRKLKETKIRIYEVKSRMKKLLHMNWNDNWKNYVLYGRTYSSAYDGLDNMNIEYYSVYVVMEQLKDCGLSVYDAYLKGLKVKYSSSTLDIKLLQQELVKLKKAEIKLIKSKNKIDYDDIKVLHDLSEIIYECYAKLLDKLELLKRKSC